MFKFKLLVCSLVVTVQVGSAKYCSGKFEDCSHTGCCAHNGFECFRQNPFFSGCHEKCPEDWDCEEIDTADPDCADATENCEHVGCCQDEGFKCYIHNKHWAQCKDKCPGHWDCTEIVPETATPIDKATPAQAEAESEGEDDGIPKMGGTHFWDCNGGSCDAPILQPWDEKEYVYAPQYAPADPEDYGGAAYGEKLWMTGAASDALSEILGPDREGCGSSTEGGGGCGQCVIVRNPTARNPNWTAVVMKKNRCPPASPGCDKGAHMDLAVPGFDLLHVSLSNVCGKSNRRDTFITASQSGICGSTHAHSCDCSGIPDDTPERKMLRKGCELFKAWGWHHGAPRLNYQPVECPPRFVQRVRVGSAFSAEGIISLAAASSSDMQQGITTAVSFPWILPCMAAGGLALFAAASLVFIRVKNQHRSTASMAESLPCVEPQEFLAVSPLHE
mmetsp:Transcript_17264/g.33689  ORF Transcript_17264/g.33689 Transcript_17264/m.33689 type:complete len:446 (-) Transcript_17264:379-1716(-)